MPRIVITENSNVFQATYDSMEYNHINNKKIITTNEIGTGITKYAAVQDFLEKMKNQEIELMSRNDRYYGVIIGDNVRECAFGNSFDGIVIYLGSDNNGGKMITKDNKEMKIVLEWCKVLDPDISMKK